ncbi:MAG: FlgD immunoglobulin-like domain containing protein [Gaiellaceae bacterium]
MFTRFAPPVLVTLLVVATGIAFAVTERLKLEPPAITSTRVTRQFSPTCGCNTSKARIAFSLRRSERVTLVIVNSSDHEIRQLIGAEDRPSGPLHAIWDGHNDSGQLAPDGNYQVRVYLANKRLRTTLPNIIQLDTQAPKLTSISLSSNTISPDGDHNKDALHIGYHLNERARILLFVDGKPAEQTRYRAGKAGKFDWKGRLDGRLLMGWHTLTLRAIDLVGNESAASAPLSVRIRFLALRPTRISVAAGAAFQLTISSDRDSVRWRFNGEIGLASSHSLELRAPMTPGRYRATVRSGPYRASTLVTVR